MGHNVQVVLAVLGNALQVALVHVKQNVQLNVQGVVWLRAKRHVKVLAIILDVVFVPLCVKDVLVAVIQVVLERAEEVVRDVQVALALVLVAKVVAVVVNKLVVPPAVLDVVVLVLDHVVPVLVKIPVIVLVVKMVVH